MLVRLAVRADLPGILAIYNHYVLHSVATFDTEPQQVGEREAWFAGFDAVHPCLVAEVSGEVVGYAYYTPLRPRPAYAGTKETTVYVAPDACGGGVGSALYAGLIEHARAAGVHALIGVIGGDNPASVALHRRFGFSQCGQLREVGHKFGAHVDTHYYELLL